jgi:hypothetical protein
MESQSKILVFKTNLETEEGVLAVSSVLNGHPGILRWTVDKWDVDKVLRIEASDHSSPSLFMDMIRNAGFDCDELPD